MRAALPHLLRYLEGWGVVGVVPEGIGPHKGEKRMWCTCMHFSDSVLDKSRWIILHAKHVEAMQGKSRKFLPHTTHFGLLGH